MIPTSRNDFKWWIANIQTQSGATERYHFRPVLSLSWTLKVKVTIFVQINMKSKALFLLVIFLLNTLVGFACALQIEYKSQGSKSEEHVHDHSSHAHDSASSADIAHNHGSHKHSGNRETAHKKPELNHSQSGSAEDGSCCQDEVRKFYSLDKIAPQSGKIIAKPPVLDITGFYYTPLAVLPIKKGFDKYLDNRQRPPTNDIRIAIQSFQI